jgi:protein ImuA
MTDHAQTLAALRRTLEPGAEKHNAIPLGHGEADACLHGGLRHDALHEVFPGQAGHEPAAIGFAVALAVRMACGKKLLWVRQDFAALEFGELSAAGLLELGLHPSRLLLVQAADATDALRAAHEALTCASLGAIVAEIPGAPKVLDLVSSRRLTLSAAAHDVPAILLRPAAQPEPSAAETRWLVRAAPSLSRDEEWGSAFFDAELARNRHGAAGRWVMEWSADDGLFKSFGRTADTGVVAAATADRSYQASEPLRRSA